MRGAFLLLSFILLLGLPVSRLDCLGKSISQIDNPAMVISASSGGRYAVSSHQDNQIILWDLVNRKRTVISKNANIYSAYFVHGTNLFLWQDLEDIVHLQGVNGEKVKTFQHFPTYGHVLSSDLKNYVSCDSNWTLYIGYGEAIKPIKKDGESPSFAGQGKLLNLTLSKSGNALLSAGRGAPRFHRPAIRARGSLRPWRAREYRRG